MTTQTETDAISPAQRMDTVRQTVLAGLDGRHIVLVGLMGAGKTAMGRVIASRLNMPFVDSDAEIETVSTLSIPELFAKYGEPEFRDLERRVIARLLDEPQRILSLGGGAFMSEDTRKLIAQTGLSVWIDADLDLLFGRVSRKPGRPLLQNPDPKATLKKLMEQRSPIYRTADVTVQSEDMPRDAMADRILGALADHFTQTQEHG